MEALQKKGVFINPDTVTLINGLHSQHQTHALRYIVFVANGEKTFMPTLSWTIEALDELLMLTRISTQEV
jgi:hypothetical protein